MTNIRIIFTAAFMAAVSHVATAQTSEVRITVGNSLPQPRTEMVEVEASALPASTFVITDSRGGEVPWQLTYDGKIIFPASVGPEGTAVYNVAPGKPAPIDERVYVAFYPERVDDMAWENDYAAYRAYGPAFGESGGAAYGYDVFTKSTTRPVVPERYFKELVQKVSYHVDHGDGMDVYDVGPTLGGGATAPVSKDGRLIFPGAFSEWRILDNGPLRATFELTYHYGGGKETRLITLDAGTPFNHTVCRFEGFNTDSIAAGVAVHKPAADQYVTGPDYVAFNDPTTSPGGRGVGRIFVGVINPQPGVATYYKPLPEAKGSAVGHALAVSPYSEGSDYSYYWGSSWNKGRIMSFDGWINTLEDYSRRLRTPLTVSVSR
ncbi:MAG: DUF4861 domain-containing protein [Bacteroides sp.]|nr:DUF4861 domain-containing protein [Bacteroides sp.]MBD5347609.1 DUF4861 domain-containing protein [Bacteroides sp.]